jgi:RND family efflux transporter MFP subunit
MPLWGGQSCPQPPFRLPDPLESGSAAKIGRPTAIHPIFIPRLWGGTSHIELPPGRGSDRSRERQRMDDWARYAAAVCLVLLLFLGACKKAEKAEGEAPAPVQVTAVTQDTIRRIVAGDGILFPHDQAVVTAKIAAPVQRFHVNRGDHVKQGQLLAMLESRDLRASAAEAKGAMQQAESNLRSTRGATVPEAVVKAQADMEASTHAAEAARKVLDSRQQLYKEGALARRMVDEAQVTWAQADANLRSAQEHLRALHAVSREEQIRSAALQVESAQAHLQSIEAQVGYSEVHSPISGVVSDRPLYQGEISSPGAPLLTIMDISSVVARVNVPQTEAGPVKVGQTAILTSMEGGEGVNGKVTVVSPATDPNSTTVQVWIQAENPGERLKPGTSVHAQVITEMYKAATVVPAAAILPGEEGGPAVLTVSPDSVAHRRTVTLGVREGNKIQILAGVNPGDEVVVVGGMGIDDKAKVKVIDTSVKESAEDEEGPEEKEEKPSPKAGTTKDEAKPKGK